MQQSNKSWHYRSQDVLYWSGICILSLAIAGFILLLGKNLHVKSWWAINV